MGCTYAGAEKASRNANDKNSGEDLGGHEDADVARWMNAGEKKAGESWRGRVRA